MRAKKEQEQHDAAAVRLGEVLHDIEGDYFFDYAFFTGSMREYTVRSLEDTLKREREPSDYLKRMFMLAVFREQYTAYEDLGAFLDGFLRNALSSSTAPLSRIMSYAPSDVRLAALFERFAIEHGDDLVTKLNLLSWAPQLWSTMFPSINIETVLRRMCACFVIDCAKTQTDHAVIAFNKLKHGLMFIPSARRFRRDWLDAPAILFQSRKDQPGWMENPVTTYQIPLGDKEVDARLQAVHFVETGLRFLSALYVMKQYPGVLRERGMTEAGVFQHSYMSDVMDIVTQLSNQPWEQRPG
jgi:hypothetical protein